MELGASSVQVAFTPDTPTKMNKANIDTGHDAYSVGSHLSFII